MEINRRLTRTSNNSIVAGVCGGISKFYGLDPALIRIVTLILILAGGLSLWVYLLLWIIIPRE